MLLDFTELDPNNKGELYHTLYVKIKEASEQGVIKKGEKLPSVREAAAQLGVSRTTVENAYARLCIEGIAESFPQRGYFITGNRISDRREAEKLKKEDNILYDFSTRRIDTSASDTELWKRLVRSVLWDSGELTSYGDRQGELGLRQALADYSYKARGVRTNPENIVIGAGVGPLINILCGLIGRDVTVGIENGGFATAESIFADYGIKSVLLDFDSNGATVESVKENNVNVLFLLPSALSKISVAALGKRRNEFALWAEKNGALIIEDDYNGELRYTARTVPAFQSKLPDSCVYIGSFSKLLLPSVRIAYMVLPDALSQKLSSRKAGFNQTCGKIEQLALKEYITSGALEKHLKKLRRLYYNKSRLLCRELENSLSIDYSVTLYESSLILEVKTDINATSEDICRKALQNGIRVMPIAEKGGVKICFAGIAEGDIPKAVKIFADVLEEIEKINT